MVGVVIVHWNRPDTDTVNGNRIKLAWVIPSRRERITELIVGEFFSISHSLSFLCSIFVGNTIRQ